MLSRKKDLLGNAAGCIEEKKNLNGGDKVALYFAIVNLPYAVGVASLDTNGDAESNTLRLY